MMNFGLSELRLVNPVADHLNDEARRMAVRATPILEKATVFADLKQALADTHFSCATTRRLGKYRGRFLLPETAADLLLPLTREGKIALVFGREDQGLATSELECCQRLLTIPTHGNLKSLNLAQSVAICLYQIFCRHKSEKSQPKSKKFASGKSIESLYAHMRETLLEVDYLDPQNPDHILRSFRAIFGRAQLDEREVRIIHGLFSKIDWIDEQRKQSAR
jgi:tRNA/rRNA methyltransferase